MNWDAVFITLGSAALAIAGIGLFVGPLYVEDGFYFGERKTVYRIGSIVVLALIIAGALLLGLGVPTG